MFQVFDTQAGTYVIRLVIHLISYCKHLLNAEDIFKNSYNVPGCIYQNIFHCQKQFKVNMRLHIQRFIQKKKKIYIDPSHVDQEELTY